MGEHDQALPFFSRTSLVLGPLIIASSPFNIGPVVDRGSPCKSVSPANTGKDMQLKPTEAGMTIEINRVLGSLIPGPMSPSCFHAAGPYILGFQAQTGLKDP